MVAREKRQKWSTARLHSASRAFQSLIVTEQCQSRVERIECLFPAARRRVNLCQVQMELGLVASQLYGDFAELRGLFPFAFGTRDRQPEKRKIERVVPLGFKRRSQVNKGRLRIPILERLDTLLELLNEIELDSGHCVLRWQSEIPRDFRQGMLSPAPTLESLAPGSPLAFRPALTN